MPMPVATARRAPSGEYCISLISPLPRRAIAPAGKFNFVTSAVAVCGRKVKSETANRNKQKIKVVFIILLLIFIARINRVGLFSVLSELECSPI